MPIWNLMFLAGKPQVVYALLWADQPWFLQLLLHTAPCGICAVQPVPCFLQMLSFDVLFALCLQPCQHRITWLCSCLCLHK